MVCQKGASVEVEEAEMEQEEEEEEEKAILSDVSWELIRGRRMGAQ